MSELFINTTALDGRNAALYTTTMKRIGRVNAFGIAAARNFRCRKEDYSGEGYLLTLDTLALIDMGIFRIDAMTGITVASEVDLRDIPQGVNESHIRARIEASCPRREAFSIERPNQHPNDAFGMDVVYEVMPKLDVFNATRAVNHKDMRKWQPYLDAAGFAGLYRSKKSSNAGIVVVSCTSTVISEQLWYGISQNKEEREKHRVHELATSDVYSTVSDAGWRNATTMLYRTMRSLGLKTRSAAAFGFDSKYVADTSVKPGADTHGYLIDAVSGRFMAFPDYSQCTNVLVPGKFDGKDSVSYFNSVVPLTGTRKLITAPTGKPMDGLVLFKEANTDLDWADPAIIKGTYPPDTFAGDWKFVLGTESDKAESYEPIVVI